jgi:hypothetical protein
MFSSCSLARQYGPSASRRFLATITPCTPQTIIEKVVQKYAVGLPDGKIVKAGDYVMIRPEHVMTHDNTGPVVSKCVVHPFALLICKNLVMIDSSRLELHEYKILLSLSSPLTMTFKTDPRRILPSTP